MISARNLRDFILVFTLMYAAKLWIHGAQDDAIGLIAIWSLILLIVLNIGIRLQSPSREKAQ